MSKSYRCRVKVDLKERVAARDAVEYELDLGRILGKKEEAALLRQKLRAAGGVEQDGKIALEIGGVRVEVDPDTGQVRAEVEAGRAVEHAIDEERQVYNVRDSAEQAHRSAQAAAEQQARSALEAKKAAVQNELDGQVRGRLGRAAPQIVRRLREVRAQVEKAAMERKAARLGTVVARHESEDKATGDRSLTLEVELPD